jgi:predicted regulator of Ras-like GTPase activity (Roadblock/LC7/MglB family)
MALETTGAKILMFDEAHLEAIGSVLRKLQAIINARVIILSDTNGQVIIGVGKMRRADAVMFSSLSAGSFMAMKQLGKFLKDSDTNMLAREGESNSVVIADIMTLALLNVVTPSETPIGTVRLYATKAINELRRILESGLKEAMEDRMIEEAREKAAKQQMVEGIATDKSKMEALKVSETDAAEAERDLKKLEEELKKLFGM